MERIMQAQTLADPSKQAYMRGKRILEINPKHPIIKDLQQKVALSSEVSVYKWTCFLCWLLFELVPCRLCISPLSLCLAVCGFDFTCSCGLTDQRLLIVQDESAKQAAKLVYETALLESGFILEDPKDFATRLYSVIKANLNVSPDAVVEEEDVVEEETEKDRVENAEETEPNFQNYQDLNLDEVWWSTLQSWIERWLFCKIFALGTFH